MNCCECVRNAKCYVLLAVKSRIQRCSTVSNLESVVNSLNALTNLAP